jgi:ornithine--oxo-acid transaminase
LTNQQFIQKDLKYVAHNYSPLPVTIAKGKGVFLYDVENKKYLDFHSGYSSTNQGHSHPKILKAFISQAKNLT